MTTFLFEFKDQMLKLEAKPQPRIETSGSTCHGCVFSCPFWCSSDEIRRQCGPNCIGEKLIFVAADKATEKN